MFSNKNHKKPAENAFIKTVSEEALLFEQLLSQQEEKTVSANVIPSTTDIEGKKRVRAAESTVTNTQMSGGFANKNSLFQLSPAHKKPKIIEHFDNSIGEVPLEDGLIQSHNNEQEELEEGEIPNVHSATKVELSFPINNQLEPLSSYPIQKKYRTPSLQLVPNRAGSNEKITKISDGKQELNDQEILTKVEEGFNYQPETIAEQFKAEDKNKFKRLAVNLAKLSSERSYFSSNIKRKNYNELKEIARSNASKLTDDNDIKEFLKRPDAPFNEKNVCLNWESKDHIFYETESVKDLSKYLFNKVFNHNGVIEAFYDDHEKRNHPNSSVRRKNDGTAVNRCISLMQLELQWHGTTYDFCLIAVSSLSKDEELWQSLIKVVKAHNEKVMANASRNNKPIIKNTIFQVLDIANEELHEVIKEINEGTHKGQNKPNGDASHKAKCSEKPLFGELAKLLTQVGSSLKVIGVINLDFGIADGFPQKHIKLENIKGANGRNGVKRMAIKGLCSPCQYNHKAYIHYLITAFQKRYQKDFPSPERTYDQENNEHKSILQGICELINLESESAPKQERALSINNNSFWSVPTTKSSQDNKVRSNTCHEEGHEGKKNATKLPLKDKVKLRP